MGAAPYDAPDLDWFAGMDPENVKELGWALEGEETLVRELEREADETLEPAGRGPSCVARRCSSSAEADRAVLQDPTRA